jgi:amino acid transporter
MAFGSAKLRFNGAWSMAVGGMVGGGIFSTLGVVISITGKWASLSFLIAGLLALGAGYSYVKLAILYRKGGGSFTFLREINAEGLAGTLAWILIVGYVLTNAVYAFTFGEYLGHVVGLFIGHHADSGFFHFGHRFLRVQITIVETMLSLVHLWKGKPRGESQDINEWRSPYCAAV